MKSLYDPKNTTVELRKGNGEKIIVRRSEKGNRRVEKQICRIHSKRNTRGLETTETTQ